MGHDLHITRADDWTESAESPIAYEEWASHAEADDSLTPAGTLHLNEDPLEQTVYAVPGGPTLHWWRGEVVITGADESHVEELKPHAVALAAHLQGDDGELY
jgi:hypothetical protein